MARNRIKVAVICGGPSSEREVSLKSGEEVLKALPRIKYSSAKIEIMRDGRWLLGKKTLAVFHPREGIRKSDLRRFDVAFVAMHGRFGEDGKVQAILETLGVPYTGSGVLASALGMNKIQTNRVAESASIPVPRFTFFANSSKPTLSAMKQAVRNRIGYPCVIKPNESGSSVGTTIVKNESEFLSATKKAFKEDDAIIAQQYIRGRELTCGVLGNSGQTKLSALPIVEIIPEGKFFDYHSKYFSEVTKEVCPAPLQKKVAEKIKDLSRKAHAALGCDGLTRSDFILSRGGVPYFLEINTIPGLTEASLCPKEARAAGMTFGEFLDKQIELALLKQKAAG
ncbi:D-alanine--D-alanine ligase [Candidatus Parcubacteria bacterium]|nr:MAG: D-alanine--D-alanine ligase [Candidatus Parcubacteria bacterium]